MKCVIKVFLESRPLTIIFASVHEEMKSFKCKMCDESFSQNSNMERHISAVHEEIKGFKCKMCEKSFSYKSNMEKHMTSIHEGKQAFNL